MPFPDEPSGRKGTPGLEIPPEPNVRRPKSPQRNDKLDWERLTRGTAAEGKKLDPDRLERFRTAEARRLSVEAAKKAGAATPAELAVINAQQEFLRSGVYATEGQVSTLFEQLNEQAFSPGYQSPAPPEMDPTIGIPEGYKGGKTGPRGEPLPEGAESFNTRGEVIYGKPADPGSGIVVQFLTDVSRFFQTSRERGETTLRGETEIGEEEQAPSSVLEGVAITRPLGLVSDLITGMPASELWDQIEASPLAVLAGSVIGEGTLIGEGIQLVGNVLAKGRTEGPLQVPVRFASALVNNGLSTLNLPALVTERFLGTLQGVRRGETPEAAYVSSRIAYSAAFDYSIRKDFIRRWQDGEDPVLLQAELENPTYEMVGQVIFDPLNVFDIMSLGATKSANIRRLFGLSADLLDDASDVAKLERIAVRSDDVADMDKYRKVLAESVPRMAEGAGARVLKEGRAHGLLQRITSAKRSRHAERTHNWLINLYQALDGNADRVRESIGSVIVLANKHSDEAAKTAAAAVLLDNPAYRQLLSPKGLETINLVSDYFVDTAGNLSTSRLDWLRNTIQEAHEAAAAGKLMDIKLGGKTLQISPEEWLIRQFDDRVERVMQRAFPTLLERVDYQKQIKALQAEGKSIPRHLARFVGDDISRRTARFARLHERLQAKAYGPANRVLSDIFMGYSMPYGARNYGNNVTMAFADDPRALTRTPSAWMKEIRVINGGMVPAGAERAIIGGPGAQFKRGRELFGYKIAEIGERAVGAQLYGSEFTRAMETLWDVGDRDLRKVLSGVVQDEDVTRFHRLVAEHRYDYDAAWKAFNAADPAGRRLLDLTPQQERILKQHPQLYDDVMNALGSATDGEDFRRRVRGVFDRNKRFVNLAAAEEAIVDEASPFYEEWTQMLDIVGTRQAQSWKNDLLARRQLLRDEAQRLWSRAYDELKNRVLLDVPKSGRSAEEAEGVLRTVNRVSRETMENIELIIAAEKKEVREALDLMDTAVKAAREDKDWALLERLVDEYRSMGGVRDSLHVRARERIFAAQRKGILELRALGDDIAQTVDNFPPLHKAIGASDRTRLWDMADPDLFALTGRVYPSYKSSPFAQMAREFGMAVNDANGVPFDPETIIKRLNAYLPENVKPFTVDEWRRGKGAVGPGGVAAEGGGLPQSRIDEFRRTMENRQAAIDAKRAGMTIEQKVAESDAIAAELERMASGDVPTELADDAEAIAKARAEKRMVERRRAMSRAETLGPTVQPVTNEATPGIFYLEAPDGAGTLSYRIDDGMPVGMLVNSKVGGSGTGEGLFEAFLRQVESGEGRLFGIDDLTGDGKKFMQAMEERGYVRLAESVEGPAKFRYEVVMNLEQRQLARQRVMQDALAHARANLGLEEVPLKLERPFLGVVSEHGITEARLYAEQDQALEAFLDGIVDKTISKWDDINAAPHLSPEITEAVGRHRKDAKRLIAESRVIANEVATEARDFALHNYNDRYGFDVLAGYVWPYHFWYDRTYAKTMLRITRRPGLMAGYAKYRSYIEKKHAGMPNWWKYNVNSNELLGLNSDSHLLFNLEAFFNPMYGLTGVDFNDKDRRETWWGATMDDLGKMGPTPFLPLQLAVGVLSYATGRQEQGRAFAGGRLIAQTQLFKSLTALAGVGPPGGVELDPLVMITSGRGFRSSTKWEENRIGRALYALAEDGVITREQAEDAAHYQEGPVWDMGVQRAARDRALGNILGGTLGAGIKGRSQTEMQIDQAFADMRVLILMKPDRSPAEYRQMWSQLHESYPFMNAVLMARKRDRANDEAYVWSVLSRIPPGQSDDFAEMVGVDGELMDRFYLDKGDVSGWNTADRNSLMGAMESLGAILEIPPTSLRFEWNDARAHYSAIFDQVPDDVENKADVFFDRQARDPESAREWLRQNPDLQAYFAFREQTIFSDPILMKYYGGIDFVEGSWRRQMYTDAEEIFGEDIQAIQSAFYEIKDRGGDTRSFLADHPQLDGPYKGYQGGYWAWLRQAKQDLGERLGAIAQHLPETPRAITRPDADQAGTVASNVLEGLYEEAGEPPMNQIETLVQPYLERSAGEEPNFSLSAWIDVEAEKRWPGVVAKDQRFESLSASNPLAARTFLDENTDLQAFRKWERETRNNYNRVTGGRPINTTEAARQMAWSDWRQAISPDGRSEHVVRLLVDYFRKGTMSDTLRERLKTLWRGMGSPYGSFSEWLNQAKESWSLTPTY